MEIEDTLRSWKRTPTLMPEYDLKRALFFHTQWSLHLFVFKELKDDVS